LQVRQQLPEDRFDRWRVPADLSDQHGALHRGNAELRHLLLVGLAREPTGRLLFAEKGRKSVLYDFKEQAHIRPDQVVVLRDLVADRPEGTTARHAKPLLRFDVGEEPFFEIVPTADVVIDLSRPRFDGVEVMQQY